MKVDALEAMDPRVTPSEDAALLARYVERDDRPAMGILFARHADGAYRLALRVCGNAADAEDAVQVAFIEVLRHAAKYRGASSVRSWIFGFVVNSCRHKAREEGRRAAREERAAMGEAAPAEDRELQSAVRSAVQGLDDPYRVPVWLHYCEGLSSGEVADSLGLSENTVRSQLSRGVERLRGALAGAGVAAGAAAITTALGAVAVESAPASLTASLSAIATNAAPAAVSGGALAKAGALSVCLAAVVTTSAALWWGGVPEDPPPPEVARVEEKVREWQPRPDERRFDEIGWVRDVRRALLLSREHGRPVAVLTLSGPVHRGRSDGGSLGLRADVLSDPRVIALLNSRFVPVYYENDEPAVEPEELRARRKVYQDALRAKLEAGSEYLYFVEPREGRVVATMSTCHAAADGLAAQLEKLADDAGAPRAAPLVRPGPQSLPPPSGAGDLVLHVTSRYLDAAGKPRSGRGSYSGFPAEDWLVLAPAESAALAPREAPQRGQSWEVDPAVASRLFVYFCPVTGNWEPEKNRVFEQELLARVAAVGRGTAWVRLEGRLRMSHSFFPSKDERTVEASVLGFAEVDTTTRAMKSLRLVTERGAYGKDPIGVAVRSVR
jgi:RNA polymerase sigma-70 factor (ECF subfamily)